MGYRSDVKILIYGPEEKMVAFIAASRMKDGSPLSEDSEFITTVRYTLHGETTKQLMLKAKFDNVKWYDNYPDVAMWNNIIPEVEGADLDYEFMRIGEASEDIEHHSSSDGEHWLGLSCEIVDYSPEEPNQGETQ